MNLWIVLLIDITSELSSFKVERTRVCSVSQAIIFGLFSAVFIFGSFPTLIFLEFLAIWEQGKCVYDTI